MTKEQINEATSIEMSNLKLVKNKQRQIIKESVIKDERRSSIEIQEVNPLKIVYFIINYPCSIICSFVFLSIIMIIVDSFVFEITESGVREWYVNDSAQVHKFDALMIAPKEATTSIMNPADPRTQESLSLTIVTIFKTKDGSNILSNNQYLSFIKQTNDKIINNNYDEYSKLCLADSMSLSNCSSTAYNDPLIQEITASGYDVDTITDTELSAVINSSIDNYGDQFYVSFQDSFATSTNRESSYYRAFYKFGFPYPDINATHSSFKSIGDNNLKQESYYDEWVYPIWEDIQLKNNNHDNIEVIVFGNRLQRLLFDLYLQKGNLWAFGSILIVWFIMFIHMKSLFLASAAMLQIILGFPISYFFYGVVFQITYFKSLQFIVIFVILGIAADDCFVFVDAWVQSEHIIKNPHNIMGRMSYTYKRSMKAMLVTTSTTAIAFLATSFSPIMPVASFGIWSAIVVTINYILMLTYFPACLSWYYQHFKEYESCCCCCFFNKRKKKMMTPNLSNIAKRNDQSDQDVDEKNMEINDKDLEINIEEINRRQTFLPSLISKQDGNKMSISIEKFLRDTFSEWILKYKYIIFVFFMALIGISMWKSTQLQGLSKQESFFAKGHFMRTMFTYQHNFFGGNTQALITPFVIWGIDPRMDRSGTDPWNIEDLGKVQYDDEFDLSSIDSQQFIYNICQELLTQHSNKIFSAETELKCFIYDLIDYANTTHNMTFPLLFNDDPIQQKIQFTEFIATWTKEDTKGKLWLNDGHIGYFENENKLKYIRIRFKLQMFRWIQFDTKKVEFDFWENKMKEWNNNPLSPSNGFQTSAAWAWMVSEKAFVSSAIQGVMIALPAAFIVLLLSTHNWILSIFAILTIIGILSSEIMIMVLQGWQLGVTESIAVVIMIGFSIDYVVHIACSYIECPYSKKRDSRIRYSLYTMGISILYGVITTFAAGLFLIFPEHLFFKKFGILIMSIVLLSLLYASGFLMSLLAIKGPIDTQGNIRFRRFDQLFCKKR